MTGEINGFDVSVITAIIAYTIYKIWKAVLDHKEVMHADKESQEAEETPPDE